MMGSGLLLTTAALFALVMAPPIYKTSVKVDIQRRVSPGSTFDPNWLPTEIERIQAKVVLYPVITNLDLQARWAKRRGGSAPLPIEDTYRLLKERLEVRHIRGTSLIEISVSTKNPEEAALIANMIAENYFQLGSFRLRDRSANSPLLIADSIVEIVEPAEPPTRPSDKRDSMGLLPIILFAVGLLDVLVGYFVVRPTLSTHETIASDGRA